jgi:2-desacetyl-2-hydroxyethyl bacteriochlorophyllide A dehydrogenase
MPLIDARRVVFTREFTAELEDFSIDPDALAPHEVLVQTECTAISAGTELAIWSGVDPDVHTPGAWPSYPHKAGYANVGRVQKVGAEVNGVAVGDRIMTFAHHASHAAYDTRRGLVHVPESLDSGLAAYAKMGLIANSAASVANTNGDPWVVVLGLGAVGNVAAQQFAAKGLDVIGFDPVEHRRALAKSCGLTHVYDTAESPLATVRERTKGKMAGIVVEATGRSDVTLDAVKLAANFGEVILLGSVRTPYVADVTPFLREIHLRWVTIKGALEWMHPGYETLGMAYSISGRLAHVHQSILAKRINLEPLISHRMPAAEVQSAYEGLHRQPEVFTGVVLNW